jgi:hypothetical protein
VPPELGCDEDDAEESSPAVEVVEVDVFLDEIREVKIATAFCAAD